MSIAGKHAYRFGYLKSEEWQTVRAAVLARDKAKCALCENKNLHNDVHHIRYPKNIWDTKPEDCIVLCRKCHKVVHFILEKGISLDHKGSFNKLRNYMQGSSKRKEEKNSKKNKRRSNRCICCHRSGLPLEHHQIGGKGGVNTSFWMWCNECWAIAPVAEKIKWSELRAFFDIRREMVLKKEFDNAIEGL